MIQQLQSRGRFTYDDLQRQFAGVGEKKVARQSIQHDISSIKKAGFHLEVEKSGKEVAVSWPDSRAITVKQLRSKRNVEEKRAIAAFVASLICGFEKEDLLGNGVEAPLFHQEEIITALTPDEGDKPKPEDVVVAKVRSLWRATQRSFVLDAGTTTDEIAKKMSSLMLPTKKFSHLQLWTNSRSIFQLTGLPDCQIKTVMIGGEQRHQTETVSGELAQQCIAAWDPRFSVSVIGATVVDLERETVGAYNDSESLMKAALLSRGGLRIVVADSSKFCRQAIDASASFSRISPEFVDLIVTDGRMSHGNGVNIPAIVNKVPIIQWDMARQ